MRSTSLHFARKGRDKTPMFRRVLILVILALFAFGDLAPSLFVSEAAAQEQVR